MLRKVAPKSAPGTSSSHRIPRAAWTRRTTVALGLSTAAILLAVGAVPAAVAAPPTPDPDDAALAFDSSDYTTLTVTIDGQPTSVRWYQELCYVADPIPMAAQQQLPPFAFPQVPTTQSAGFQSMNVFVPESAIDDADTALYFAVNNAGWFASYVGTNVADGAAYDSAVSNVGAALKAGYVYIDVGTRSRGVVADDGSFPGKAPAAAVDAKAAVRYLRLNDASMPGSAERIVVNGTSGGGALASILGASGNSRTICPTLPRSVRREWPATGRARCATTFSRSTRTARSRISATPILRTNGCTRCSARGRRSVRTSGRHDGELAAAFPAYEKSLKLRTADGSKLSADNMLAEIQGEVVISAEAFMAADPANVITGYDWIVVDNDTDTVVSVGHDEVPSVRRPAAPAQAGTCVRPERHSGPGAGGGPGAGESNLFGSAVQEYSNFTAHSWNNNIATGDGIGLDDTGLTWDRFIRKPSTIVDEQTALINPMLYIGTNADTAPYWYVRNGALDRDTAFTVSINLDRALDADRSVRDVNYRLAWNTNHAGNYDVPEAMQWIEEVLADADAN